MLISDFMELYRQAPNILFFDTTLARAARVLRERDVPQSDVLICSLTGLQHDRDAIVAGPEFLHMDDFHTANIIADGTTVSGFIDLEITRN